MLMEKEKIKKSLKRVSGTLFILPKEKIKKKHKRVPYKIVLNTFFYDTLFLTKSQLLGNDAELTSD